MRIKNRKSKERERMGDGEERIKECCERKKNKKKKKKKRGKEWGRKKKE